MRCGGGATVGHASRLDAQAKSTRQAGCASHSIRGGAAAATSATQPPSLAKMALLPTRRDAVRVPSEACRDRGYSWAHDGADEEEEGDGQAGPLHLARCGDEDIDVRLARAQIVVYQERLRLARLIDHYATIVSEALPCAADVIARVRQGSVRGLLHVRETWIAREMAAVSMEYARAQSEAIFFYLARSALFRELLAPLRLPQMPERTMTRMCPPVSAAARAERRTRVEACRAVLMNSILWSSRSSAYFVKMHTCWEDHFQSLILFDLPTLGESDSIAVIDCAAALRQIQHSMRAAFTNIRVVLYTKLENLFYSVVSGVDSALTMTAECYQSSPLHRILVATRVYLVRQIRALVAAELSRLLSFFVMHGQHSRICTLGYARTKGFAPLLRAEFVITDAFMPLNVELITFRQGVYDLFHELWQSCNGLPCPEYAIMRNQYVKPRNIHVMEYGEIVCARAAVMATMTTAVRTAARLTRRYAAYTAVPFAVPRDNCVGDDTPARAHNHVRHIRRVISAILTESNDVVCCGRFLLDMAVVRHELAQLWRRALDACYAHIHTYCASAIRALDSACRWTMSRLEHIPTTVAEIDALHTHIRAARESSEQLRLRECTKNIIVQITRMESNNVVITEELQEMARHAMAWPATLAKATDQAEHVVAQRRPELCLLTRQLRRELDEHMTTLSSGIVELYNMFNLEICDIAVQTCDELNYVVKLITSSMNRLLFEEKALGVPSGGSLDTLYPQLRHFETISLFWTTINQIGNLRAYYASPVKALNAREMMDRVRHWRRQLHYTTRQVRGFAPCVSSVSSRRAYWLTLKSWRSC